MSHRQNAAHEWKGFTKKPWLLFDVAQIISIKSKYKLLILCDLCFICGQIYWIRVQRKGDSSDNQSVHCRYQLAFVADGELLAGWHFERAAVGKNEF